MTRALLPTLTLIATLLVQLGAHADGPEGPTWEMNPLVDLPIVATELTIGFGWLLGPQLAPAHCAPVCDREQVWWPDRFSAGWHSSTWATAGDLSVALIFVASAGVLFADEGFVPMLSDAVVIAEAVAGSIALSILTNMSTRRPRPYVYGTDAPLEQRQSGRASYSFFSGHTAGTFAAAVSTFLTLRERHPESSLPWITLSVGLAGASFVGLSRIVSGEHFLTDTLAGAIVGVAMGLLVPSVHSSAVRIYAAPTDHGVAVGARWSM
jgi:membrane-associated phospholipid phosphatase